MTDIAIANRNKQAATYGLIVGIVSILFLTIENMVFAGKFIPYYGVKIVGFLVFMLMLGMFTKMMRTSMGGHINFKNAFSIIFVMVLVSEILYFIYTFIYMKYIDPDFMDKIKNATITWMEKVNSPQDKIDETVKKFDDQIAESKHFNFGKTLLAFFSMIVFDSLFGLIVAAIVKKEKPLIPSQTGVENP